MNQSINHTHVHTLPEDGLGKPLYRSYQQPIVYFVYKELPPEQRIEPGKAIGQAHRNLGVFDVKVIGQGETEEGHCKSDQGEDDLCKVCVFHGGGWLSTKLKAEGRRQEFLQPIASPIAGEPKEPSQ